MATTNYLSPNFVSGLRCHLFEREKNALENIETPVARLNVIVILVDLGIGEGLSIGLRLHLHRAQKKFLRT